ncbi:polyribonucleotide nucleotidyltransferase [Anaerotignum propionicum]|uniref:Polyribonucleotide nucleotidyltransferase n=1 Tax=Anaerotignum propionicum DSM 1682 TaxID=991789 RepID=A0A120MKF0_ANAPI|nr:polyribonucleotide nucleotidyltransferase [Anaerotignum propionicum]AMJ42066.1 polyribonucleotide nucleotidyltransferase [Anaerotignum propionicum DSM 1682]MEA5057012.1 polyribonucleotide nucleotidyltransferase [Anaerotignum propionicum]SHE50672.1 polyribonucleotide nucleotidyltransferase [[Clostridium] propionicum DSM 1682] [Anaerotignum propionicum DSM 1682]
MFRTYTMDLAGRTLTAEIGRVAEQANGAVILRYGETTVLVTATASQKPREGIDFFPLSIDYEERLYSVGKIPGGFIKREGRPSEKAVLTSRCIDRPLRPLFPKDYRNDVAIVATVMSVDQDCSPEVIAMIGASLALNISDIPFTDPVSSVSIGYCDGQLVVNPTADQRETSRLSLTVSSKEDKVMMIEAGADEIPDELMMEAIHLAFDTNLEVVKFIKEIVEKEGKEKAPYEEHVINQEAYDLVTSYITDARMEDAVFAELKQDRDAKLKVITEEVTEALTEKLTAIYGEDAKIGELLGEIIYKFEKMTVRRMILKDHKRPDGRGIEEIRKLSAEIDVLPRVHGSALFSRGQTQCLTVTTLGMISEGQRLDGLDTNETGKRYIHHYNFPGYSVGEAKTSRGPGRREIGHGALGERALLPVIPSEEEFPYAIRLVSDILSSNGSTSQASICGSTLSLMAAGVPIKRPVAGISVGLVTGDTEDDFVEITDIQGVEDFFGDMDFKVAGTSVGITAIQMDMKIKGLTFAMIEQAFAQTGRAREYILNEVMLKAIPESRKELSPHAPKIASMQIDVEKIAEVIGTRGKVIKKIIEETGCAIDTEDDGTIFIKGINAADIQRAIDMINAIVKDPIPGTIYTGAITRLMAFGAFFEIAPGKEGLIHISKISNKRVEKVEDVLAVGDIVSAKLMEIDKQGRLNFSIKDALPQEEKAKEEKHSH